MLSPTQSVMRRAELNAALQAANASGDRRRIQAALGQLTRSLELQYGKPDHIRVEMPADRISGPLARFGAGVVTLMAQVLKPHLRASYDLWRGFRF